jgi:lipopolysaccharide biosynthesis regulator YciM
MIKIIKKSKFLYLFAILAFSFTYTSNTLQAQSSNDKSKKEIKYKKARALQSKTAKKMAKVYEALEEVDEMGEPAPDMETAVSILTELKSNFGNMKSYDRSVVWNALGYAYYATADIKDPSDSNKKDERTEEEKQSELKISYAPAINAYRQVLAEPESTIPIRTAALYTLAQLSLVTGDFEKGIETLLQWMDEVETVTAQAWGLLGTAYYQVGNYKKVISSNEKAIQLAEEEGYKPKENWYNMLAAAIGELKKDFGEKNALLRQVEIYEILVNLYPKKIYFIQLGGTYGQLGREKDYMITLKAAHAKDFLNKEGEYLALAQLLLLNQNPYWAAQVLVSGQKKLITSVDEKTKEEKIVPVVKDTEKNLKLLADSWRMAQEIDKAIPVLEQAAKISKDGKAFVLLGNLYLSEDKLDSAVDAIKKGLEKGKIKKVSQVYLTLGQAYFELQEFEMARKQFRIAARDKDKKVKTQANNWLKYTENEEIRVKNLALRRDYIQSQS